MILTKPTYCPNCYSMSLELKDSGKVTLLFDGKKKESSAFIFNLKVDLEEEVNANLLRCLNDYFKWYGSFNNKEVIKKVEAISSDFRCTDGCSLDANFKPSVVGILFSEKIFESYVKDSADSNDVELD